MSILDSNNYKPSSDSVAQGLKTEASSLFNVIVSTYINGTLSFWNNPYYTPAEMSTALGNDAKEMFELHYKLGQLINSIKPEAILETNSHIGNFTLNEDGTVTVI
jgi:hypothetical protein